MNSGKSKRVSDNYKYYINITHKGRGTGVKPITNYYYKLRNSSWNYIMSEERKISITISILKAIISMYENDIIHGDLKPDNLAVHKENNDLYIKVIDYGTCFHSSNNIKLKYIVANTPVEVIDEYKNWRKINDYEGNKGWIHKSLIKGKRFAIVDTLYAEDLQVFNKPKGNNIGKIGKRNILEIDTCLKNWCKIKYNKNKGWINKKNLWGIYEKEKINIPFYQPIINLIWKMD